MRQAIKDVHVQAFDANGADHLNNVTGLVKALLSPDAVLYHGVKVLHTDGRTGHAHPRQSLQTEAIYFCRVDLDRKGVFSGQWPEPMNGIPQFIQHVGG